MKRSGIFAAALTVAMLSSVFSPFAFGALAGTIHGPTDAELAFEAPEVIRVLVDENHRPNWPGGATSSAEPFSSESYFWAPFGTDGVTHALSGANPHVPTNADGFGEGWIRSGTALGSISRGAWGNAWGPWLVGGNAQAPFRHFSPAVNRFPANPTPAGIFEFDNEWNSASDGSGQVITRHTVLSQDVTLHAQWFASRYVHIRHQTSTGDPINFTTQHEMEQLPNGGRRIRVGDTLDLGANTTNLHMSFIGFNFHTFNGWSIAVGTPRTPRPASYLDGTSPFNPNVFNQTIEIPYPQNLYTFAAGRLYLIANWRVVPPGVGQWVPPVIEGGGGGGAGGGAGGGQQTSPPGGGGVIGGGVGAGQMPGGIPGLGDRDGEDNDAYPYYTAVPGTGGAPLIPIITTFPAVTPVPSLPAPFTPTPLPEAPVVLEIPQITVPIVGFDSNTWALMNLILAIVGGVGAVLAVAYVWRKNRKQHGEAQMAETNREAAEESRKRRKQWLFAVGLVSLVSIVLFPLTQDMSNRMTLFDVWTIAHVILLVAQGVAVWQILRRGEKRDDDSGGGLETAQVNV